MLFLLFFRFGQAQNSEYYNNLVNSNLVIFENESTQADALGQGCHSEISPAGT